LRRAPSKKELLSATIKGSLKSNSFRELLRDMVDSTEFRTQILPALIAERTNFQADEGVFLHVPKTGGTGIREQIGHLLGVPSINIYEAWSKPSSESHKFWPYWAGHANIGFFPKSHAGFTLFRDTKSRLLSLYRQREALWLTGGSTHGWNYPKEIRLNGSPVRAIESWLLTEQLGKHRTLASFFHLSSQNKQNTERLLSQRETREIFNSPPKEQVKVLTAGLKRIKHAAWLHDTNSTLSAISYLAGSQPKSLAFANSFESKKLNFAHQKLSKDCFELLDEAERHDRLVFEIAEDLGLIPKLDKDISEKLFQRAVERLNFSF
jgi:hypothetical protein